MNKLDFVARQLSRAEKKRYEHYVVTRIWHLLNDTEVKFVTQQYVKRPDGIALTDMYFPQFKLHVEIDERQHFDNQGDRIQQDAIREADIINATGHRVERVITANRDLEDVNVQIGEVVATLRELKQTEIHFRPWDFEAEYNPATYITRGYIDLEEDVAFRTMVDAANCFGNMYQPKGLWKGGARHPDNNKIIWFPKLYKNGQWNNNMSDDGTIITEMCENEEKKIPHINATLARPDLTRIVFARVKSPLGDIMYRFVGEFAVNVAETNHEQGVVYNRINVRAETYAAPTA